jgi:hypothetical protein
MSKQLTDVMKLHLAQQSDPTAWVFPGKAPEMPMHPTTFLGRWTKLLNQAGITYRKPHALRHTYASLLIQNGESLAYVKGQLGHSSIKITVDTYGHLAPGGIRQRLIGWMNSQDATYTQPGPNDREGCQPEGENKWSKNKSLSTATSAEVRAIKRWSIYRKRAWSLLRRTWRAIPRPCRSS